LVFAFVRGMLGPLFRHATRSVSRSAAASRLFSIVCSTRSHSFGLPHFSAIRSFSAVPATSKAEISKFAEDVFVVPWNDEVDTSPVVKASLRTLKGKDHSAALRKNSNYKQVPAILHTKEFGDNRKNVAARLVLSVDPGPLLKSLKVGELYNTVFHLQVEGQGATIPMVCSQYEADTVSMKPMNFILHKFLPGRTYKVKIPVKFENEADSVVIKKGGHLLRSALYANCYWKGDDKIPRSVTIDVMDIRVGRVYKLDPQILPDKLTIRYPKRGMPVLGSCRGSKAAKEASEDL